MPQLSISVKGMRIYLIRFLWRVYEPIQGNTNNRAWPVTTAKKMPPSIIIAEEQGFCCNYGFFCCYCFSIQTYCLCVFSTHSTLAVIYVLELVEWTRWSLYSGRHIWACYLSQFPTTLTIWTLLYCLQGPNSRLSLDPSPQLRKTQSEPEVLGS